MQLLGETLLGAQALNGGNLGVWVKTTAQGDKIL